jgi:hypothetical protein
MRHLISLSIVVLALVLPGVSFADAGDHLSVSEALEDRNNDGSPDRVGQKIRLVGPTVRATVLKQLSSLEETLSEARAAGNSDEVARLEHIKTKNAEFLERLIEVKDNGELCFPVTESANPPKTLMVCSHSIRREQVVALDNGTVAIVQGTLGARLLTGDALLAPHRALIGRFLVLLALALAAAGTLLGFISGRRYSATGEAITRRVGEAFCLCLIGANAVMLEALLRRDISVSYVDQVGSHLVPNWIAIVSLWSSLEGSILFWGLIFGLFTWAFIRTTASRE